MLLIFQVVEIIGGAKRYVLHKLKDNLGAKNTQEMSFPKSGTVCYHHKNYTCEWLSYHYYCVIYIYQCAFYGEKCKYRKSTSIRHFEQCNQQLSNLICQNCDGSITILLDVGNQQHAV